MRSSAVGWVVGCVSCLLMAAGAPLVAQAGHAAGDALKVGFERPPQAARLRCYWWWMNGYTTVDTITKDLTEMKERGYAGVLLVDAHSGKEDPAPEGPAYGSAGWRVLYLHALKVAKSLGMEISLSITDGGNVGILGGDSVTPADALKLLTFARVDVEGGKAAAIKLPEPEIVNGFYRQIAVLAYPLRHGVALAGATGSDRMAIANLNVKIAARQDSDSMERPEKMFRESAAVDGEQDTELRDVVNISAHVSADGSVDWKVPAGEWEILRVGYTDSKITNSLPGRPGLAVDALSQAAFDHYWDHIVAPILAVSKPYIGTSLRYLVTDSWEGDGMNWTDDFREQFLKLRGYDPVPYLAIASGRMIDSREVSNRFLADLRRTVGDLLARNYYDRFAERAAAYGLGTHPEAGGPHSSPMDALLDFRKSSLPQTEFWAASTFHRIKDEDRFFVKEAASAAHIYGKRYVAAEGFSRMGDAWDVSPGNNLKPTFDRALTEGLNRLFWHEFTSSPDSEGKPGIEYFADSHLDRNVTWWNQAAPMLMALNRAQFLMQQGVPVVDVLYFAGNQVPGFVRLKSDDPAHVLPGYEYDVTNEDALLHHMLSDGGALRTPEGIRYRALALPAMRQMSLPALKWVEKFVRGGGIAIGLQPVAPAGLISATSEVEYKRIVTAMWSTCGKGNSSAAVRYGAGRLYCTSDTHAAMVAMQVAPDFTFTSSDGGTAFDFVHRRDGASDIYFVRNDRDEAVGAVLTFRAGNRVPEIWNVDTGETLAALVYRRHGEQVDVPLNLPAHGSAFFVFRRKPQRHAVEMERAGQVVYPSSEPGRGVFGSQSGLAQAGLNTAEVGSYELKMSDGTKRTVLVAGPGGEPQFKGSWTLSFPAGWGAPASVGVDKMQSWTQSVIPGVRYFSGTATYESSIDVPTSLLNGKREVWINLGDVREVAKVMVNGATVRTLWHPPFLARIDGALHAGENDISIRVTNLWPNRLIGDAQPGEKKHYTRTNITTYTKDSPLLPSGLLSPLTLQVFEEEPLP